MDLYSGRCILHDNCVKSFTACVSGFCFCFLFFWKSLSIALGKALETVYQKEHKYRHGVGRKD